MDVNITGFPEYGCQLNREKTLVNFDMTLDGLKLESIPLTNCCGEFPWCGMLVNTRTLNVVSDMARYFGSCRHLLSFLIFSIPSMHVHVRLIRLDDHRLSAKHGRTNFKQTSSLRQAEKSCDVSRYKFQLQANCFAQHS